MNKGQGKTRALYRWDVAARVALAFVGGFVATNGAGALFAILADRAGALPLVQAAHIMTLSGFAVWCALAMWIFHERRLKVVAALVIASALLFPGLSLLVSGS